MCGISSSWPDADCAKSSQTHGPPSIRYVTTQHGCVFIFLAPYVSSVGVLPCLSTDAPLCVAISRSSRAGRGLSIHPVSGRSPSLSRPQTIAMAARDEEVSSGRARKIITGLNRESSTSRNHGWTTATLSKGGCPIDCTQFRPCTAKRESTAPRNGATGSGGSRSPEDRANPVMDRLRRMGLTATNCLGPAATTAGCCHLVVGATPCYRCRRTEGFSRALARSGPAAQKRPCAGPQHMGWHSSPGQAPASSMSADDRFGPAGYRR